MLVVLNNEFYTIDNEISEMEINKLLLLKSKKENDKFLKNENLIVVTTYKSNSKTQNLTLLCKTSIEEKNKPEIIKQISEKIYLAAPLTQVHILLPLEARRLLFNNPPEIRVIPKFLEKKDTYYTKVQEAKEELDNFFTYDFFAVNLLIDLLREARNKDFEKINLDGTYGTNYMNLLKELNSVLSNKKIVPNSDLTKVSFKQADTNVELNPEDLSHGELKRLSIFMWIKFKQESGSVVLIDEIENTLHPDWQFQIIRDMSDWSPENQFILATHSYEVCDAVTPAHVKELNPKLLRSN